MTSHLEAIVSRAVAESLVSTLSRTAARFAEEAAEDLLRDPTFRSEMHALLQAAFRRALADLERDDDATN
jgi:hypothetical protein